MRYFYDSIFASGFMIDRHGFKLVDANGKEYSGLLGGLRLAQDFMNVQNKMPLYVHPDSLHLLEPIPTEETADGYLERDLCHVHNNGRDYYGTYHACVGICGNMEEIKIIQRNGTAFHWPEVEA